MTTTICGFTDHDWAKIRHRTNKTYKDNFLSLVLFRTVNMFFFINWRRKKHLERNSFKSINSVVHGCLITKHFNNDPRLKIYIGIILTVIMMKHSYKWGKCDQPNIAFIKLSNYFRIHDFCYFDFHNTYHFIAK